THVILQWGNRPLPDRLVRLAEEREWVVRNFDVLTLDEIVIAAEELAEMFAAERAGAVKARLEQAWAKEEGLADAGRILLLHSVSPPGAMGPGSFHYQVLERIG